MKIFKSRGFAVRGSRFGGARFLAVRSGSRAWRWWGWPLRQRVRRRSHSKIFRTGSDAVRVFVTVTDRDGRLVTTLGRDNFEIRDDGKPQPLTQFDNSAQPIRLIVLLDVSGSMEGNLPLLRSATVELFKRLLPEDVARLGTFGHEVTISPAFTHNSEELLAALPAAIMPNALTPLWRALTDAIEAFGEGNETRKVILVLSDGKDTGPIDFRKRPASQADVIDRARLEDVMIYAVGLGVARGPDRPASARGGFRRCCLRTSPIPVLPRSPKRPAGASPRSGSGRTWGQHLPGGRRAPHAVSAGVRAPQARRQGPQD